MHIPPLGLVWGTVCISQSDTWVGQHQLPMLENESVKKYRSRVITYSQADDTPEPEAHPLAEYVT